jgi:hypothetical protein
MQLTRLQRHVLISYRSYREKPPRVFAMMAAMWKADLILFLAIVAFAWMCFYMNAPQWGLFMAGMGVGAKSRDFGIFRIFVKIWPALGAAFDWNKVDALIDPDQSSSQTSSS